MRMMHQNTSRSELLMTVLFFALLAVFTACNHEEDFFEEEVTLTGTYWRLTGFVNVGTNVIQEPQEVSWPVSDAYTITFMENGKFIGCSAANEICGSYTVFGNKIHIICGGTKADVGVEDDAKFRKMLNLCEAYEIKNNQLFLYYNGSADYLLLIPK